MVKEAPISTHRSKRERLSGGTRAACTDGPVFLHQRHLGPDSVFSPQGKRKEV